MDIGDERDDRARGSQLEGQPTTGYLLRRPSSLSPRFAGDSALLRWAPLAPQLTTVWNSAIPFSLNDGATWAGRGWTGRLQLGIAAERDRFFLILAPELLVSENRRYEVAHPLTVLLRPPERHPLSSPWHVFPSIDAPLRFGERRQTRVDFGQSTIGVRLGNAVAGLSTENEWWGPGIRNAIVMSNHAPGIPRAFLRTDRPVPTPIGTLEGSWFLGALFESPYFDAQPANDKRSISGGVVVWQPQPQSGLSLGLARTSYARIERWTSLPLHALDLLRGRGTRAAGDSGFVVAREQIVSLFGRWVFPADRFAVHFEWARTELPHSLRDLLTAPNHSQGYTLGLEWGTPVRRRQALLRLQAEATYLEKSPSYRDRPVNSFYTSPAVAQGYTQRGQVIGAAIGQGASSQWVGVDYFASRGRFGVFLGRIRWDDDALYTFPTPFTAVAPNKWCAHDVSFYGGVTLALERAWGRLRVAFTRAERLNVFFHNLTSCDLYPDPLAILDARNTTIEIRFAPR